MLLPSCHEPLACVFWFHVYNERLVHSPQIVCLRSASYMITESARRTDVIMASTMETQRFIILAFRRANARLTLLYNAVLVKFRREMPPGSIFLSYFISLTLSRGGSWAGDSGGGRNACATYFDHISSTVARIFMKFETYVHNNQIFIKIRAKMRAHEAKTRTLAMPY